jgi:nicotinamide-nucleotide amidase
MTDLSARVGEALSAHDWLLATAESCTGGGVAQAITEIAGSSAWFERGFITYANSAKIEMLGVRLATLDSYGAVSEMTVREMAIGALAHSQAQVSVAVSGIAGPTGGSTEKPVGTVWFAWAFPSDLVIAQRFLLLGTRAEVRQQAVNIALQGLLNQLNQAAITG